MTPQHDRLIKLLKMLTTQYAGERLNAVSAINQILEQNKWTWDQLLSTAPPPPRATAHELKDEYNRGYREGKDKGYEAGFKAGSAEKLKRKRAYIYPSDDPAVQFRECKVWYDRMTPWEKDFLNSAEKILDNGWHFSDKQLNSLKECYAKARGWSYARDMHPGTDV